MRTQVGTDHFSADNVPELSVSKLQFQQSGKLQAQPFGQRYHLSYGLSVDEDLELFSFEQDPYFVPAVIDVYVRYLREKIDRPFGVESIETLRGVGYRLRADGG